MKEFKRLRESANCQSKYDCPYTYDSTPLLTAINVELQKSNSRMVLERTPLLEDLIESDLIKCELTVAKKKENAVESLRGKIIKPTRIHEEIKKQQNERNNSARRSGKKIKARRSGKGNQKPLTKKKISCQSQGERIRKSEGTMRWNMRNCLDLPPRKPPDNGLDDTLGTGKAVNMEVERGEHKWPPDPPDPPKLRSSTHPADSDVVVVFEEHPLAKINLTNSQTVSTPTTAQPRVLNHAMLSDFTKDPAAMHWEPPDG